MVPCRAERRQAGGQLSIGLTPDNQVIFLFATIVGLIVVPVLFWVIVTVFGLIGRILGLNTGFLAPLLLLTIPISLLAASLALDQSGQTIQGQVIDKRERVLVSAQGSANDELSLSVRYSVDGKSLPPFKSTGDALVDVALAKNGQETSTLRPDAADFDRFRPGDSVDLRVLRIRSFASLVRLTDQSTRTMLPLTTIAEVVGLIAVVILAWKIRNTPIGYLPLAVLAVLALLYPLVTAYQTWQYQENLTGATERATATVQDRTRVTKVSLTGRSTNREDSIEVPQPYDVVQLTFVPPGYPDTILAIDAVDVDSTHPSRLEFGTFVDVVYPPGNPREARMLNQTRTHFFKTTLEWYLNYALLLGFGVVLVLATSIVGSRLKRTLTKPPPVSGGS